MKKIILIILMSFSSLAGYCQLPVLEDFEGATFPPTGWLVKDNRTDGGQNWKLNTPQAAFPAHSGVNAAFIDRENTGQGVYTEEWLITPQQNVPANYQLQFYTRQTLNGDTGTKYQIRVSSSATQDDLSAYTVLKEYSETELSTLTADQLDYEIKSIDLPFTGLRYFAFVKVFTQPGAGTSGDRWLVDDVSLVLKCLEPTGLGANAITPTSANLFWVGSSANYEIEYGFAGFTPGTGTVISGIALNHVTTSPLTPGTGYQFYVKGVCPNSESNLVGPFNFVTPPLGSTCASSIQASGLPYSDSSDTIIYGNNITSSTPGNSCGAGAGFLGGNDVVYTYTPPVTGNIIITMNPLGATNTGVFVYSSCANVGSSCIAGVGNANSNIRTIPSLAVQANVPIYIVISSTTATTSFGYNLIIQQATCPAPTTLTATSVTTDSEKYTWVNGTGSTSTSWEVATQLAGQPIPTGSGTPTTTNTNYVEPGLTAGTAYQYWVRADCGGGLFSPWSGPFLFNTALCNAASQCNYSFILTDTGGDGWETGTMQVKQGGIVVATLGPTLTNGGPVTVTVPLCNTIPFDLFWNNGGNTPTEVRVAIKNSFGQQIYALTTSSAALIGTTLFSGMVDCDNALCLPPTTASILIPAGTITTTSATINWTSSGAQTTGWGIYVVPVGSPAPVNGVGGTAPQYTVLTPTASFTIPLNTLLPDTAYNVYIESICSANSPSDWSGPKAFTTLQSCFKPTGLLVTPQAFSATLSWTNNGTATAWEVIVLPAGSPAPLANDPGWIPAATNPFVYNTPPLVPETNYVYYVRSVCGGTQGTSNPAGPKAFTTLASCIKPTGLLVTPTPFGGTFSWTNATGSSWQVLILPAGSPAPLANATGWVPATSNPFLYNGTPLVPETNYVYYVRTDCGIVNGLSSWAGPKTFTTPPSCIKPTALLVTAGSITPFGATFSWTNPTGSAWQVLVLPAGSPAPTATSTGWVVATGNPFIYAPPAFPALIPETNYVYYVRSDCGATNGLSTWAGPKAFTTLQQCVKPTVLTVTNITAFTAQLGWSNAGSTATAWQVIALPVGSPVPGPGAAWVDAPTNPFVLTGLTSETAYVYYVRGNCGPIDGWSNPAGPKAFTTIPSCYKPTLPTVTSITPFTAQFGWTNNNAATSWQILILPAGSPAPTASSTGWVSSINNPDGISGLTPDTCYDIYVRSDCGAIDGLSQWSVKSNFCTPPTCPKPINLVDVSTNDNSADLNWTETGPGTSWSIVVQTSGGPAPGTIPGLVHVVNTLPTVTSPYNTLADYGALAPGFYEFYVRSNCTPTDLSAWSGPFAFFIATSQPVCASVGITVQTTSPGQIDLCPGTSCVPLTANYTDSKDTTAYTVLPVNFAPPFPFTGGIELPVTSDDQWSAPFTLPFNFCFYGVNYPSIQVGSNGVLTFNPQATGVGCPWNTDPAVVVPDPAFPILNAIYGVYQDIDPTTLASPAFHTINYQVLGQTPCRAFVVNYFNIGQFSCHESVGYQTSQIVLYETSNIIEVYVKDRTSCTTWNEGSGVIGIQNAAGSEGVVPPGRNLGTWEAHNEAWRFTPNGASTVQFSWLKDGVFYSNNATINVCVSEDTMMTAQAFYTGCGGQTATKTDNVLLHITPLTIPPMQNVNACQTYTLPTLTIGHYFASPGGIDPIDPLVPITGDGVHTIYVYATTTSTPACTDEISFTVTIGNLVAPVTTDITACKTYTLPVLDIPFRYYDQANGQGTAYDGGAVLTASHTFYIYGQSGVCTAESLPYTITIDDVTLATQAPVSDCNSFVLPNLPANNTYYTQTGGPNGTGTTIAAGTTINTNQTIYIYAESGTCHDEGSFTVTITGIQPPTLSVTQATCLNPTGAITVLAPVSPGSLPANLFISEVTDEEVGSLTYVELFNGTGAPVDLSNYKLKIYNNGNAAPSCDLPLSGMIANNATNVIKVSSNANQGGVVPNQTFPACGGVNTNDNIRLTTSADVEIDLWGRTDGVDFTPSNLPGYTYRRINTAPVPSTTWNPADWTAIDPQDYTNVGSYTPFASFIYQYNIDGGPWQFTTTFNPVAIGSHIITAQEISTGCTASATVIISPAFTNAPVTTFTYATPFCLNATNPLPDTTATGFTFGGTYTADSALVHINASTGEIDLLTSTPGAYTITYTVLQDLANCISGGSTSFPITIGNIVPNFAALASICSGTVAPLLATTSPNGITGTWLPATVSNTVADTYVFTPDPGQCATTQSLTSVITAPSIVPDFAALASICSGTVAPLLATTSPNGITGTWLPATVSNTVADTYVFTPDPGQCATTQSLTSVITAPSIVPDFAALASICSGTVAPLLATTSPNGITGSWLPATVSNTVADTYVFTPDPGQCATSQSLTSVITAPSIVPDFAALASICSGNVAPLLASTSPNGITGTWLPSTVSNTLADTYVFTPDPGQCATTQSLTSVITPPTNVPDFTTPIAICSNATAPILGATSPNGITGTWSPTVVSTNTSGTYIFTPNPGQCATTQNLVVNVTQTLTPDFAATTTYCAGGAIPALSNTSPNGVSGSWSPSTIDANQSGSYLFTPDITPTQPCAVSQTVNVVIDQNPEFIVNGNCINGSFTLTVTAIANIDLSTASYIWKDSTGATIGNNTPSIIVNQIGTYTCQVNNDHGCSTTSIPFPVTTVSCSIQKGISPKGVGYDDGLNDYFDLAGFNVKKLEIFNRYGAKVYTKTNYINEWYGQSDAGAELPDGTYFYVIQRDNVDDKTGWIYINREK